MVLEKLTKPIIQKLINEKLNKNQFGFRPKSDCGLAKAMIFFNAKKYKYNKSLLIDIKKAYDSVNLEKLIQIVNELFKNEADNIIINSFIKIYQKLTLIINNTEINPNRGLPQGSALSPLLFSLYINNILNKLNEKNEIHLQAYADDIIIQGKDLQKIQEYYNKAKEMVKELDLEINPEKCELISDNENDIIIDHDENGEEIIIQSKRQAKYLGQIINENGIPTNNTQSINFGNVIGLLSKFGDLTKLAKIRIFQTFMRSKINHLIPLIILTGGTEELWKDIRKFIFHYIIECNTLPRESASAFGLGFYEIMIRPLKKLIERNYQFTNNKEENEMLNDCLIQALKQWIKMEPKHSQKIKEIIVDNIEKKKFLVFPKWMNF